MAPVLDVAFDPQKSIMMNRAFGSDPGWVSELGEAVIQNLQRGGIMSVAKHFPGIGRTTIDSHVDLPLLETEPEVLQATDLVPFASAIENNVAGVMLSHICFTKLDANWPASMSVKIARDLLRKRMGYEGLVITDDLDMGAIKPQYTINTVIERILKAEIDIALICHKSVDIEQAFDTIVSFQTASRLHRKMCRRSLQRIMWLKGKYLSGLQHEKI